jgi:PadR family transcriptional regulator PadR
MRRKPGVLLPIEVSILSAGIEFARLSDPRFHGYAVAKLIRESEEARRLTAHGTLYRALERLEAAGLLESELEDADAAAAENRPRRRLYRVTALGQRAHAEALAAQPASAQSLRKKSASA